MIFVRLWYRNDVSQFPHVWDGVGVESKNPLPVLVRYVRPSGPMCLRCLMLMPSGPVELLFLLFRMAADISDVVSINVVLGSL